MNETTPQIEAFSQMIVAAANREHGLLSALIEATRRATTAEAELATLKAKAPPRRSRR